MGVVFEVRDRERDMRVALKTLRHLDAATLYRFKREFRSLANLTYGMRSEVRESMSQELATLCGYTPWSSYGMTDHPSAVIAAPGDETAGRLA